VDRNADKVGIVVVSYNASEAVRVTLASLRQARNRSNFKLILVDNASDEDEREKISTAMAFHTAEVGEQWRYLQQERNLGFSGGNNVGIAEFLRDPEISHVCLLNSDVIVTDHWLDRLLKKRCDLVSAVTNKSDSEQCVPIDYQADLFQCLKAGTESLDESVYQRIRVFADRWHRAWQGNIVESEVTFFCALISCGMLREVGLLDEAFFPGGFEDDDYCIRARNAGYRTHLARDTFIHHWGSASFGQLQYDYFSRNASRNKRYLEEKHAFVWQRRPEKPFVSFAMDMLFASKSDAVARSLQQPFVDLYIDSLSAALNHFESEFIDLSSSAAVYQDIPDELGSLMKAARAHGDLRQAWRSIVAAASCLKETSSVAADGKDYVTTALAKLAQGIHDKVECNFAMHDFMNREKAVNAAVAAVPPAVADTPVAGPVAKTRWKALWRVLWQGLRFLFRFDGVVFFGGYFYPERQSDGYIQRIQIVDRLFADQWRVYVESDELRGRNIWFDRPEPKVLVLRVIGPPKRRFLVRTLAIIAALRSRKIYYHSVLRMYDNRFGWLLRLPGFKKAVDIHGVVPEEFRMHNDFFSAVLYEKEEHLAVEKAGLVIAVTESMSQYLRQKFRDSLKAETVLFPMFPSVSPCAAPRPYFAGKPVVVYAGGLHKWQQVSKMIAAITATAGRCHHRFYCPDPQTVKEMLPAEFRNAVTVEARDHSELMGLYSECHYGFILREDIVVNHVACPTKLVEYLAMGIVPIVDCENIGDFKTLGMAFIRLEDFLADRLPDERGRAEMAVANLQVYAHLKAMRENGAQRIYRFFTPAKRTFSLSMWLMQGARRALPLDSWQGRKARTVWRWMRPLPAPAGAAVLAAPTEATAAVPRVILPSSEECDILVQVDNFDAGGLENVVIDLSNTMAESGYGIVLLVLGSCGPSVGRARALGMQVICQPYAATAYADLLERLRPRMVIAHYSIQGLSLCRQRAIPVIQVIHNAYVWFDAAQRRDFARSAADTTVFVAVSEYAKRYGVARLGLDERQCIVIQNGIDFKPFDSMDGNLARTRLRVRYGIEAHEFVFLDVGAINHQKNHLGTLRAFELARKVCPALRLVILGPAYEKGLLEELETYIDSAGLGNKAIYCGAVQGASEYFAMADAFVSGAFFEGCSLALLEAIRADLPVAMPAVGTAGDFHGRPGFEIVEPAFDVLTYSGTIAQMRSGAAFESRLAEAMLRVKENAVRPGFSALELARLEKEYAYAKYLRLVAEIVAHPAGHSEKDVTPPLLLEESAEKAVAA